ncbi:MAG: hypothetical protein HKN82_16305 [Akkermansiaceae bacterium]|nr:hypothetical protein [Akkermansiaceae bacterium]
MEAHPDGRKAGRRRSSRDVLPNELILSAMAACSTTPSLLFRARGRADN